MSHKLRAMNTPIFWAEGHPGHLSRDGWQVTLDGLVGTPRTFTFDELLALPKTVVEARLTSVTRWSVGGHWGGVHLSTLLTQVGGALPGATHVQYTSYRRIYTTTLPLEIALRERSLLAYEYEEDPLDADYGGPIRGLIPYLWGYKSAKSIIRVTLLDHPVPGYWEIRGYPDAATILPGHVLDVNTGRRRRIPGGEVREFLD